MHKLAEVTNWLRFRDGLFQLSNEFPSTTEPIVIQDLLGYSLWLVRKAKMQKALQIFILLIVSLGLPDNLLAQPARPAANQGIPAVDSQKAALIRAYVAQLRADPTYQFTRPLRFYGKVLDQDEKPVADADIGFTWNRINASNNAMETGTAVTKTDAAGLFSFEGQTGNQLDIAVTKPDFYKMPDNPTSFEYADPSDGRYYTPEAQNPVIFHMRKRGQGVRLITSQNGMRSNLRLDIPRDGTPVKVDLLNQKGGDSGPLQISQLKPSNVHPKATPDWSVQISIPDGGLVEFHDAFPFEAPEAGYNPVINISFQNGQTNWASGVKKDFYIQFGNPRRFGRMTLETDFDDPRVKLKYAINPDGSRNLEPQ